MTKEYDMIPGSKLPHFVQKDALNSVVHRFTGEHIPSWSRNAAPNGRFYAPQYQNDQEWLQHTLFPVESKKEDIRLVQGRDIHCQSNSPSWPWGQWLEAPFVKGTPAMIVQSLNSWIEP